MVRARRQAGGISHEIATRRMTATISSASVRACGHREGRCCNPRPDGPGAEPCTDPSGRPRPRASGRPRRPPRRPRGQHWAREEPRPHHRRPLDHTRNCATSRGPAGASRGRRSPDHRPDRRLPRPGRGSAPFHHRSRDRPRPSPLSSSPAFPRSATWTIGASQASRGSHPAPATRGTHRGRCPVRGGRTLCLAAFIASRCDPALRAFRNRLQDAGKPAKVAIAAGAGKRLTILNAMFHKAENHRKRAA
jgi:transposase